MAAGSGLVSAAQTDVENRAEEMDDPMQECSLKALFPAFMVLQTMMADCTSCDAIRFGIFRHRPFMHRKVLIATNRCRRKPRPSRWKKPRSRGKKSYLNPFTEPQTNGGNWYCPDNAAISEVRTKRCNIPLPADRNETRVLYLVIDKRISKTTMEISRPAAVIGLSLDPTDGTVADVDRVWTNRRTMVNATTQHQLARMGAGRAWKTRWSCNRELNDARKPEPVHNAC